MRIGPHEEEQMWNGRPVNQVKAVLIDGQKTDRFVRWFDPDEKTYGYYEVDEKGLTVPDPEDPERRLIIVKDGVVELVFDDDDSV